MVERVVFEASGIKVSKKGIYTLKYIYGIHFKDFSARPDEAHHASIVFVASFLPYAPLGSVFWLIFLIMQYDGFLTLSSTMLNRSLIFLIMQRDSFLILSSIMLNHSLILLLADHLVIFLK